MESPNTTIDEINDGIFRISTWVPDVTPVGFTFNQFLVTGDEPLLFHTGPRGMFPLVAEAMAKVVPVESLRWITFGHVEADECGAMNIWLAAAPDSQVTYGGLGCMVSLNDLCDRASQLCGTWGVAMWRTRLPPMSSTSPSARARGGRSHRSLSDSMQPRASWATCA